MREPTGSTLSDHGVEDGEQLPHARHQSDLLGLARCYEPSVELLYGGVVSGGNQSRHVECLPDPRSSAPHAAAPPQSAGVAVDGSHSDEGGESSLGEREPSSGNSAKSVRQSTGATPGTLRS